MLIPTSPAAKRLRFCERFRFHAGMGLWYLVSMDEKRMFDFWYAVNNTEVVVSPKRHLETFGATLLNYHHVCELMDRADQVRVRTGRLQAHQPRIITPEAYSKTILEGFGDEARKYVEWLKEHEQDVRILQYGYQLSQESFSEHTVTDSIENVVDRVKKEVDGLSDPFNAVVVGVDQPWDVCLVKLFWQVMRESAGANIRELLKKRFFETENGVPRGIRVEVENGFLAASKDASKIGALSDLLQKHGLFSEYEDRFFALVRTSRR
jgi:hypothetical protein